MRRKSAFKLDFSSLVLACVSSPREKSKTSSLSSLKMTWRGGGTQLHFAKLMRQMNVQ